MANVDKLLENRLHRLCTSQECQIVEAVLENVSNKSKNCDLFNLVHKLNRTLNVHLFRLANTKKVI